ncbi:flagellar basal body rod protein FlgB [Selenomonas sp. oral taxon 892]|jgi:flagellar basal-body rod protein flgB|uniref:flagellar basal body rod protein FlgB n=1 Tax=Selenomonas sp. oral taxon 892 TaxID=1321785 RepID=UPI0003ACE0F8|nr:flagellar basal body rod protein FlgB [Selenomonas sp. oral taxon 892]ERJ95306.1 flagellar basal-body rod protein FlgB [Selenomonas sp. oral taxon 892 str. F0426]
MLEQLVNTSTLDIGSRALSAASLRHEVLSNNIANVNTPNFKRSHVRFEDLLKQELGLDRDPLMKVVRTHDRHLPIAFHGKVRPVIEQDAGTNMRLDGNNVDIDIEMAEVAKNQLYYSALATAVGGHISKLKSVITSGQGS